ncbi:MAG: alpha/beta hydrolase [Alphaproteobacteria bacterium]|nr:alpha/beta hydrolase [Alphaproteobacteria bacterium]
MHPIESLSHQSARHTTGYLACGPKDGPLAVFVHGWPELSLSWRHQLPALAALGFRAIAPDMRGYGRSTAHKRHEDYALREISGDMVELIDALGRDKAVWIGHDWGAPVVWTMASHHPDRCHGVANLCVPYIPQGFTFDQLIPLVDRSVYPADKFPAGQWEYQLFYQENFERACKGFEADTYKTVKVLFRRGSPANAGKPSMSAMIRLGGGWFGPSNAAPDVPLDTSVLSEADARAYADALATNGFFGPDSWYMNHTANAAFAKEAKNGGKLAMPVLFLHGAYDATLETLKSRLAEPMRTACADLTEAVVKSGHWMAQEQPVAVNAHLVRWLAAKLPALWER